MSETLVRWDKIASNLKKKGFVDINPKNILPEINQDNILNAKKVIPFIEKALPQVVEMVNTAKEYSFQEYLGFAMVWGLKALSAGTYGIGAVYVVNHDGEEWVIAGRNGLRTDRDTSKHAEMDSIDAVESISRGEESYKDRVILKRKAKDNEDRTVLFTSLDPCPMCRVRIHNHNIPNVMVGNADPLAGAFIGENKEMMPPLWNMIMEAQGTKVMLANNNPDDYAYVDPKYLPLIKKMFELNREDIDHELSEGGLTGGPKAAALLVNALTNLFGVEKDSSTVYFNKSIEAIKKARQKI